MTHYKHVPFTSDLQMWSPSASSISFDFNMTVFPHSTAASAYISANYYHHEPVFYPACIICGLFHHPVPHTAMNSATQHQASMAASTALVATATSEIPIITPAPSKSSLPIIPFEKRTRKRHDKIAKRAKNGLLTYIQTIYHRLVSTFNTPFRKRRHNIYPLKRHE